MFHHFISSYQGKCGEARAFYSFCHCLLLKLLILQKFSSQVSCRDLTPSRDRLSTPKGIYSFIKIRFFISLLPFNHVIIVSFFGSKSNDTLLTFCFHHILSKFNLLCLPFLKNCVTNCKGKTKHNASCTYICITNT